MSKIFFREIFVSVFSEFSETYADLSLNEIEAKLKVSSKLFIKNFKAQKLEMKILLNEKNYEIDFAHVSEHGTSLEPKPRFYHY